MTKLFEQDLMEAISDHGIRIGPIKATHSGEIEARLPFMFIHLPTNTKDEYKR
jgi:hypothetical protein